MCLLPSAAPWLSSVLQSYLATAAAAISSTTRASFPLNPPHALPARRPIEPASLISQSSHYASVADIASALYRPTYSQQPSSAPLAAARPSPSPSSSRVLSPSLPPSPSMIPIVLSTHPLVPCMTFSVWLYATIYYFHEYSRFFVRHNTVQSPSVSSHPTYPRI